MTTTDLTARAIAEPLRGLCAGRLYLPDDVGYDIARVPWLVNVDQRPAAVAVPHTADEVAEVVRAAAQAGLRIAPQSSGHGAGPFDGADLSDVVLIRLHELTGVTIDAERRTARVLGGTLWQPVVDAAAAHGLAALHGSSGDVAVAGYALGGGLSWYARRHGLAAHSIVAAEVVLADGRLVRADEQSNPDLLWALRGGGGNFGVVTALELRLLPIADVYAGMLLWPADAVDAVTRAWAEWTRVVPDTVTTSLRLMCFPPMPELPDFLRGRRVVVVDGALLESDARAAEILRPLRDLAPELDTMTRLPVNALTGVHMDPQGPTPAVSGHLVLDELSPATVDALLAAGGPDSGTSLLSVELRHLGGVLAEQNDDAAIGRLAGEYAGFFVGIAPVPAAAATGRQDAERLVDALQTWSSGTRLANFSDDLGDAATLFDATALQRLRAIRAAVDPDGRIVANHCI